MAEEYWKRLCRSFNKKYVLDVLPVLKHRDSNTLLSC